MPNKQNSQTAAAMAIQHRLDAEKARNAAVEFHQFPQLAKELRLVIWEYALPGARIIEVHYKKRSTHDPFPFFSTTKGPAISQVNKEARSVVLKNYSYFLRREVLPIGCLAINEMYRQYSYDERKELVKAAGCLVDFELDTIFFGRTACEYLKFFTEFDTTPIQNVALHELAFDIDHVRPLIHPAETLWHFVNIGCMFKHTTSIGIVIQQLYEREGKIRKALHQPAFKDISPVFLPPEAIFGDKKMSRWRSNFLAGWFNIRLHSYINTYGPPRRGQWPRVVEWMATQRKALPKYHLLVMFGGHEMNGETLRETTGSPTAKPFYLNYMKEIKAQREG